MKTIELTRGYVAFVDDSDFDRVSTSSWSVFLCKGGLAYAQAKIGGVLVRMHRFLLCPPAGMEVHHLDGNGLNNCRNNLAVCSHRDNIRGHRRPISGASSRFRGVFWHSRDGVWRSRIYVDGRVFQLGRFALEEDAARAYDAAARKHYGPLAHQNIP